MVRKRQIPIQFDPEQIAELDKIREERRIGSTRPPYAVVVRELVADALRRRTRRPT